MRKSYGLFLFFWAFFSSFIGEAALAAGRGGFSPAQPDSVTLFPRGGRAHLTQNLAVSDGFIRIALPAGAQKESVVLDVEGFTVADMTTSVMDDAPGVPEGEPEFVMLQAELEKVKAEQQAAEAELAAFTARLQLWSKPDASLAQPEDVSRLDALMAENVAKLHVARAKWDTRLKEITERRERLESELFSVEGAVARPVLVAARILPADSLSVEQKTVKAHVSYTLSSCWWRPAYRLEALPGAMPGDAALVEAAKTAGVKVNGLVHFFFDVEIFQSTGQDWSGIPITLATADVDGRLAPPPIRAWRIQPEEERMPYLTKGGGHFRGMADKAPQGPQSGQYAPAQEQATFTSWNIGKRNLAAGQPSRLLVEEGYWLAAFSRVIRPAVDPNAYLMAEVVLPEQRHLAQGEATLLVEGNTVGKSGGFSLAGDKAKLFFGTDPRVSAVMRLNTNRSGRKGIIDRRQTRVWDWSIEVSSAHKEPVMVRIEDPQPQSGDEGIAITAKSSPAPEVKEQTCVWNLEIAAGKKQTVSHSVTMSAPQEMRVWEGR